MCVKFCKRAGVTGSTSPEDMIKWALGVIFVLRVEYCCGTRGRLRERDTKQRHQWGTLTREKTL
jgi:hypothetical protein